jgi:hypothetical protein
VAEMIKRKDTHNVTTDLSLLRARLVLEELRQRERVSR